jgi:hypothetical protein
MIFSFHYLSWELIEVHATLRQDRQPMMPVEDDSIRPGLERAGLTGLQGRLNHIRRKAAEGSEFAGIQRAFGMEVAQVRSRRVFPQTVWCGKRGYYRAQNRPETDPAR